MSKSTFTKSRRLPLWVKLLLTSLATILAVTLLGSLTTGFTDWNASSWFDKEVNEENLIKVDDYLLKSKKPGNGLEFKVDDYGVIKVTGKASEEYVAEVTTLTLQADEYTIGGYESNANSATLRVKLASGEIYVAGTESATFTVSQATTATVEIVIAKDVNFIVASTFCPTLAVGDEEIDFFK